MNLDERGGRAATDLLVRAAARPIPTVDELVGARPRRIPRRVLAVAAAVAVVAGGVTILTGRDDGLSEVDHPAASVPAGVTPQSIAPEGAGVTMQLPSTWAHTGDTRGFDDAYVDGDSAYVSVTRIATMDDLDEDGFAQLRHDLLLANIEADLGDTNRTTIDGHDAVAMTFTWQATSVTEYGIDLDDGTWAIIGIGSSTPEDDAATLEWIASTIDVVASPLWSASIEHPDGPLPTPIGVASRTWEPEGLGFSIELPATFSTRPAGEQGYTANMTSTSGPLTFVRASRMAHALSTPDAREEVLRRQFGVADLHRIDTEVDGRAASIMRYRFPVPDEPRLAALDVEYGIDMGDGTYLWVLIGTEGGSPADLIEWIRSTITVQP